MNDEASAEQHGDLSRVGQSLTQRWTDSEYRQRATQTPASDSDGAATDAAPVDTQQRGCLVAGGPCGLPCA
ncbi:hypothetical protein WQE_04912 [Paraburkholderia hospita]|uniref:Uncharacterized protein n=1 Tax=Paraburkholderia hospita TaxID=169430 RepID=A0ABN0FTY4_9BURK|nr:hypothetical protein WQE_04912 [Paraburkholderia hospita]